MHLACVRNLTKLSHTTYFFGCSQCENSPSQKPCPYALHKTYRCIHMQTLISLACNSCKFSSWLNVNLVSRAFSTFSNQQRSSSSFFLYSISCWFSPFSLKKWNRKSSTSVLNYSWCHGQLFFSAWRILKDSYYYQKILPPSLKCKISTNKYYCLKTRQILVPKS